MLVPAFACSGRDPTRGFIEACFRLDCQDRLARFPAFESSKDLSTVLCMDLV